MQRSHGRRNDWPDYSAPGLAISHQPLQRSQPESALSFRMPAREHFNFVSNKFFGGQPLHRTETSPQITTGLPPAKLPRIVPNLSAPGMANVAGVIYGSRNLSDRSRSYRCSRVTGNPEFSPRKLRVADKPPMILSVSATPCWRLLRWRMG